MENLESEKKQVTIVQNGKPTDIPWPLPLPIWITYKREKPEKPQSFFAAWTAKLFKRD